MTIEKYDQKYEGYFEAIWVDWLKNTMGIEPQSSDIEEVKNPYRSYIKSGGMAFYAMIEGKCVGVVAVKKLNDRDYEFCKLVVSEAARGLGLGKKLVLECIDFVALEMGRYLYLQSFYKLEIALKMYDALGFTKTDAPDGMNVVKRTEIIMRLKLND
jgi:ribosomal protein S18 acetylase RimI-like enzyme